MTVSIKVEGIPQLIRKLGQNWTHVMRPPMQRAVLRIQADMADYPPQRPGSSYVRTGTLGRKWTTDVKDVAGGIQGKVGNNTPYGPLVQSRAFQRPIFRGQWQTDEQVLQRNLAKITKDFQDAVDKALR